MTWIFFGALYIAGVLAFYPEMLDIARRMGRILHSLWHTLDRVRS